MRKTAAVRSLLYSGDLLAVDLGSFAVKVLSLKAKERSLTVLGTAQREVWRELALAKTDEEKAEIYARALRDIMGEYAFKPRNASISLSGNTVILRFLTLPAGYKPDSEAPLPAEAKAMIPFEEADAVVSTLLLGLPSKADKHARAEMMLAAAQKKTMQAGMDIARKAGLRPAVIANDGLALADACVFFEGNKTETVVLVNVGATSTSIIVTENGIAKAARVVNIAGNTFTRAVKRELDSDLDDAEKLKIVHGLAGPEGRSPEEDRVAASVARSLRPLVKDLSAEIHRTIDVFLERRSAGYPSIRRIVLAGGSASLRAFPENLAADAGLSVDVFRPMVNVVGRGGEIGIVPLASAFAVPCGLSLSNTILRRSASARINLVPKRVRRSAIIRDVSPGFWRLIAGPVAVVLLVCVYGVLAVRMSHREAALEHGLEEAAKREKALEAKFAVKKVVKAAPKPVADPFSFLGRLTISGVFGDSGNAMVMLDGHGETYVARGGKLFNADEELVKGVSSEIRDNSLALHAGGRRYLIALPK